MHTRQSPAKAGDCGYARPLVFIEIKLKIETNIHNHIDTFLFIIGLDGL